MQKDEFQKNFERAIKVLIPFSRSFLLDNLPDSLRFILFLNQSNDNIEKLIKDETVYINDSLPENRIKEFEKGEELIEFLYRDVKVPEWINLTIHSYDYESTYISVVCCGRFTSEDELLYHDQEGYKPFHVLGPILPNGFENIEVSGKFPLNWNGKVLSKNEW